MSNPQEPKTRHTHRSSSKREHATRQKFLLPSDYIPQNSRTQTPSQHPKHKLKILGNRSDRQQDPKRNQAHQQNQQAESTTTGLLAGGLDGNHNCQHDQDHDQHQQPHQLDILPPHLPLEPATAHAELSRAATQAIRLVHQQVDSLATLKQAFDIARHDAAYVVNLALGCGDGVVATAAGRAVLHHEVLEVGIEGARAVVGHVGKVGAFDRKRGEEALADFEEETKGYATAQRRLGDDEEGEAAGGGRRGRVLGRSFGDVVDVMGAVGVGQLLRGVMADLG